MSRTLLPSSATAAAGTSPSACPAAGPGGTGGQNSIIQLDGSGMAPSGPSQGNTGIPDHWIDLLGADDRARDDRHSGRYRRCGEAAAAKALQPVALAEGLPDALEALRKYPDELAGAQ